MTRRDFFRLFIVSGLAGYLGKKLRIKGRPRKARFWRRLET
jgi:hypothetical protein